MGGRAKSDEEPKIRVENAIRQREGRAGGFVRFWAKGSA